MNGRTVRCSCGKVPQVMVACPWDADRVSTWCPTRVSKGSDMAKYNLCYEEKQKNTLSLQSSSLAS